MLQIPDALLADAVVGSATLALHKLDGHLRTHCKLQHDRIWTDCAASMNSLYVVHVQLLQMSEDCHTVTVREVLPNGAIY